MKTKISSHANLMLNCMYNLVGEEATFFPVKQWKWGIFEATSHAKSCQTVIKVKTLNSTRIHNYSNIIIIIITCITQIRIFIASSFCD